MENKGEMAMSVSAASRAPAIFSQARDRVGQELWGDGVADQDEFAITEGPLVVAEVAVKGS